MGAAASPVVVRAARGDDGDRARHAASGEPPPIVEYQPYSQTSYAPPAWARSPAVSERAVEVCHGPAPSEPSTFVHRDFHPGNVLWQRGRLTGLVDWRHTCVGPPVVDVGHLRLNLFFSDRDPAELFTKTWERLTTRTYDPWADVVAIIGMLDNLRATPPTHRAAHHDRERSRRRHRVALTTGVEVLAAMVIDSGRSRIGVAGCDLHVAQRDPGVEGGHDETGAQHVGMRRADAGVTGDRSHPTVCGAPAETLSITATQDRTLRRQSAGSLRQLRSVGHTAPGRRLIWGKR